MTWLIHQSMKDERLPRLLISYCIIWFRLNGLHFSFARLPSITDKLGATPPAANSKDWQCERRARYGSTEGYGWWTQTVDPIRMRSHAIAVFFFANFMLMQSLVNHSDVMTMDSFNFIDNGFQGSAIHLQAASLLACHSLKRIGVI